jgi:FKBP-type peptidyl-prolyl cis-trans isomerase FkpA
MAPHHAAPVDEMPCRGTVFQPLPAKLASRGPILFTNPFAGLTAGLQFRLAGIRDVAQSGSALQWGCRGRGFKSRRPDSVGPSSGRPRRVPPEFTRSSSESPLHRLITVLVTAGLIACGGSADRNGSSSMGGFSASLGVDTATMTKTPSGLRYQELAPGQGEAAAPGQTVSVHYTGWLPNGEKFDSSRDRNQPFGFTLGAGEVIAGWDEGVAGMRVGGRRKLVIPPDLAYGTAGAPPDIPPGATLVFDVELLDVR